MSPIIRIAALYLLLKRKRRRANRRSLWVHSTICQRFELGEYHRLINELRLDDSRFQRYTRLTVAQYDDLLSRVGDHITRQDTNYRLSISPGERLTIFLRFMATGDSYRSIANSFRVGVSTVSAIVPQVAAALWECLVDEFMPIPNTQQWRSIAVDFQQRWGFPNCCGAIDGKHVVMKAPANSGSQFFNYKGTFSLVLLAVVDAKYCFTVIDVGGYGRTSDGGILANSLFGRALVSGSLGLPADLALPGAEQQGPQPHVFVADEAFPLRRNLMRPFPGRNLSPEKQTFNYRLSRARMVVENAFGILSSQWRMYRRTIEMKPETVELCVKVSCVLHNYIRKTTQAAVERLATVDTEPLPSVNRVSANNAAREAMAVRDVFTSHFTAEGPPQQA